MQEVEGFLNGTRDYYFLGGHTGPLVYHLLIIKLFSVVAKFQNCQTGIRQDFSTSIPDFIT